MFLVGKAAFFAYFQNSHTDKEKVDFLRHEYGIGGHSHALSGAGGSWEDHDGKGLHYKKGGCRMCISHGRRLPSGSPI